MAPTALLKYRVWHVPISPMTSAGPAFNNFSIFCYYTRNRCSHCLYRVEDILLQSPSYAPSLLSLSVWLDRSYRVSMHMASDLRPKHSRRTHNSGKSCSLHLSLAQNVWL